jgi:hypothetical protein
VDPAPNTAPDQTPAAATTDLATAAEADPPPGLTDRPVGPAGLPPAALVPAVRLAPGATLLLSTSVRVPAGDELAAIRAAAGPLLDLLRQLRLDDDNDGTYRREDPL